MKNNPINPEKNNEKKLNQKVTDFNPLLTLKNTSFLEKALSSKLNEIKHRVNFAQYSYTKKNGVEKSNSKIITFPYYFDILVLLVLLILCFVIALKSSYMAIIDIF